MALQRLAVVVVSYNSGEVLGDCFRALDASVRGCRHRVETPYDLIVVDNASTVRPVVEDTDVRRVQRILLDENLGFARGVNRGLEEAHNADLVLLLNPDARLAPDALVLLVTDLVGSGASIAGPLLVDELDRPHGMSERPFHSVPREMVRQFVPSLAQRRPFGSRAARTGWARSVTGACMLVRGPFVRALGGLDSTVAMYLEDIELCWQAHVRGSGVRFVRDARCIHHLGGSSEKTNFRSSASLYLTLLSARVEFVRLRRGVLAGLAMRGVMALGAVGRIAAGTVRRSNNVRTKHGAGLRWALTSGRPPAWPPVAEEASDNKSGGSSHTRRRST